MIGVPSAVSDAEHTSDPATPSGSPTTQRVPANKMVSHKEVETRPVDAYEKVRSACTMDCLIDASNSGGQCFLDPSNQGGAWRSVYADL